MKYCFDSRALIRWAMQSPLAPKKRRVPLVATLLAIAGLMPVHGAITLTIDTVAKTFTWDGSAISESITLAEGEAAYIRLGNGTWNGGTQTSTGDESLSAGINFGSGWAMSFFKSPFIGQIVVAPAPNTIVSDLGTIMNSFSDSGTRTGTISVVADGVGYSYSDLSGGFIQYLESLDGVDLYFQNNKGGAGVSNIGNAVGQIVVIPEPATAALVALGATCFLRRRRKA